MKFLIFLTIAFAICTRNALAIADPFNSPTNKVGINILSPDSEIEEAASMVNSNGDWGWAVIIIKRSEMDVDRWQSVFHKMSKSHIIPIVRIATDFDGQVWKKPEDDDAKKWADFLSKLYWPTKNRYVQIYNEVNHGDEWGGKVDPAEYAKVLDQTIGALKEKSEDFFVMEAPLDLALNNSGNSMEASLFLKTMESTTPGIFKKIDGWSSHSYPNPGFSASPYKLGKTGIDGYRWELGQISSFTDSKKMPVFITETGWKRNDSGSLDENKIAEYYKIAFEDIWKDNRVLAVSPFVFNYQRDDFYPFSFKAKPPESKYFAYFRTVSELPKVNGNPEREDTSSEITSSIPEILIKDRNTNVEVSLRNTGQFIWDSGKLALNIQGANLGMGKIAWNQTEIMPGQEAQASFKIKATVEGSIPVTISILDGEKKLDSKDYSLEGKTLLGIILENIKRVSLSNILFASKSLIIK